MNYYLKANPYFTGTYWYLKVIWQWVSSFVSRRAGEGEERRHGDGRRRVIGKRHFEIRRVRVTLPFPSDALLSSILRKFTTVIYTRSSFKGTRFKSWDSNFLPYLVSQNLH